MTAIPISLGSRTGSGSSGRSRRGRVHLAGVAITAPRWREAIETWCDVVGLDPPGVDAGLGGLTRRRSVTVELVDPADTAETAATAGALVVAAGEEGDPSAAEAGIAWLVVTTDDLDAALRRIEAAGSPLIAPPSVDAQGNRVAAVKGPLGFTVRVVELQPRSRLALLAGQGPRRAEAHLRLAAGFNAAAALAFTGFLAHLAVSRSPHQQVSFGFMIGFCTLLAAATALVGYPNGLMAGEDEHARGAVRTMRSEVAGSDPSDLAGSGWAHWRKGGMSAVVAAAASLVVLGLTSVGLLGRPVGFWLLWGWSAAIGGTALVLSGSFGRRRALLIAGRRAHGLPVVVTAPVTLLRRAWLMGALPLGLFSAAANVGLAWAAYRNGVSTKALGSDLLGSVVITAGINYLAGRQWGRADWFAGRVVFSPRMRLPEKVRLAPQGLVFAVIAMLVILNLLGHALSHPPQLNGALALRSFAGLMAGATGFGLGCVAGVLNATAEAEEAPMGSSA